jgi:hypothetical protein
LKVCRVCITFKKILFQEVKRKENKVFRNKESKDKNEEILEKISKTAGAFKSRNDFKKEN